MEQNIILGTKTKVQQICNNEICCEIIEKIKNQEKTKCYIRKREEMDTWELYYQEKKICTFLATVCGNPYHNALVSVRDIVNRFCIQKVTLNEIKKLVSIEKLEKLV